MVAGAFQTILYHWKELLSPFDLFSFMFISHKFLRWIAPHLMIIIFLSNIMLIGVRIYSTLFTLQVIFYLFGAVGAFFENKSQMPTFLYVPYYFCYMNIAVFHGFVRFLFNKQSVSWRKAER